MQLEIHVPWNDEYCVGYTVAVECNPWNDNMHYQILAALRHIDNDDVDGVELSAKSFRFELELNSVFNKVFEEELNSEMEKARERIDEEDRRGTYGWYD